MIDIVLISDIVEVPDLALGHEHGNGQRVHRSIAKALVVKAACFVEPVEIGFVGFAAPEVEGTNFEIGEELAVVVLVICSGIEEPCQVCFWMYQVVMRVDELLCAGPKRWK